ncbi:hypothetical protein [Flavobacterium sp.]|uniref:hypothetical protein n=1 Tax=Flavobacterium sp. TaxID=239 RepID=UPI0026043E1E|nr:hypothetical protein [Flavobacterium sp.]
MKAKFLSMLAAAALIFASCSSDDDSNNNNTNPDTEQNLAGNVTEDMTLDADVEYTLTGALIVRNGATLTIPAGTTIKAIAGGTGVYVLVERGGRIIADGTADAPITFTSNAATPAAGDWGGVIINGSAPISRQDGAVSEAPTEINTAILFGGNNATDNSGILDYVVIEYTGARIDDGAEHNGLTLNGVGSGTTLSNIMIKAGDDDAIEFFGGTVNASNILVVNCTDDMFDFSQGYTGTITNAYGVREAGYLAVTSDPRGIEADGNLDGLSPTDINQSNFTVNGMTIINNAAASEATMVDVIKVRRGATATINNFYAKFGAGVVVSDLIDLRDSAGDANDATTINYTVDSSLAGGAVKNTTVGGATITEGTTNTGADATVFGWTGYSF